MEGNGKSRENTMNDEGVGEMVKGREIRHEG